MNKKHRPMSMKELRNLIREEAALLQGKDDPKDV